MMTDEPERLPPPPFWRTRYSPEGLRFRPIFASDRRYALGATSRPCCWRAALAAGSKDREDNAFLDEILERMSYDKSTDSLYRAASMRDRCEPEIVMLDDHGEIAAE